MISIGTHLVYNWLISVGIMRSPHLHTCLCLTLRANHCTMTPSLRGPLEANEKQERMSGVGFIAWLELQPVILCSSGQFSRIGVSPSKCLDGGSE